MNSFWTSDSHLGHKNIIKYSNRPFTNVDDMNTHILDNINSLVCKEDTLYHLGDFCMARSLDQILGFRDRIVCDNVHLILGNHDKELRRHLDSEELQNRFRSISEYKVIKLDNTPVIMMHYALRIWDRAHHGAFHLYGHSHGSLPENPNARSFDVGVDNSDSSVGWERFTPISWDQVKKKMDKKNWIPVDHHTGVR